MDAALDLLTSEEPDADVAALAAQVGRFGSLPATRTWPRSGSRPHSTWPRPWGCPRCSRRREHQGDDPQQPGPSRRGRRADQVRASRGSRATTCRPPRSGPTTMSPTSMHAPTATSRRRRDTATAWPWRGESGCARASGMFLGQVYPLYALGRWDEALALAADVPDEAFSRRGSRSLLPRPRRDPRPPRRDRRGGAAHRAIREILRDSADLTERAASVWAEALCCWRRGRGGGAARCRVVLGHADGIGISSEAGKEAYLARRRRGAGARRHERAGAADRVGRGDGVRNPAAVDGAQAMRLPGGSPWRR